MFKNESSQSLRWLSRYGGNIVKLKKEKLYTNIRALLLLALFISAFVLREGHHFLGHHHKEIKACLDSNNNKHIHNDDYEYHTCFLCDFALFFSDGVKSGIPPFGFIFLGIKNIYSSFFYQIPSLSFFPSSSSPRGPPSI
jgi:hypothetical protein